VREPHRHDECELILLALTDLNDSHTEMLQLLARIPPPYSQVHRPWMTERVLEASTLPPAVASIALATVIARGLAEQTPGGLAEELPGELKQGMSVLITKLGQMVLDVLVRYVDADHKRAPRR
jgi:hypothetical protein